MEGFFIFNYRISETFTIFVDIYIIWEDQKNKKKIVKLSSVLV